MYLRCVEELVDVSFSDPLLIDERVFVDWVEGMSSREEFGETLENQIGHTIDQLSDSESKNSSQRSTILDPSVHDLIYNNTVF